MRFIAYSIVLIFFFSCGDYYKNDYKDNSPTSGKLKVYCEEGIFDHVYNHAITFESQYPRAKIEVVSSNDIESVNALFTDSCSGIVITRELTQQELKSFSGKNINPRYSILAYTGIALVTNRHTKTDSLSLEQLKDLLTKTDSLQKKIQFVFSGKSSSVIHFVRDSICAGKAFATNVSALDSSKTVLEYVSQHENAIGIMDYAVISDRDDPLYKKHDSLFKFVLLSANGGKAEEPNPSTFKLGTYPLIRKLIYYRFSQEFSLSKGLEAFMAGSKGQLLFLKQGLLPFKQQERNIEVKFEPLQVE